MTIFHYDKTFEGLLTAVFHAYNRKTFPEKLLGIDEPEPLFVEDNFTVVTAVEESARVWKALEKKLMPITLNLIRYVWLSELPGSDELIFRYIRKTFDSQHSIETNFTDDDVLALRNQARKVDKERMRLIELVRFQKAADGVYFAPVSPDHNTLPLILDHFTDRFADQQWVIYDTKRNYGYYYDLENISEITFGDTNNFQEGKLDENLMAADEKQFQELWRGYFKAMTIKERLNPKLHRQHLPQRYWKYLTEKQE
ncbi:MAG TPA: TIGR03915 family putative DNA repair protein [Paludibacter sp.]|nr:TIGR03915 family putative DNA repair protein [Paludibacter sp.]